MLRCQIVASYAEDAKPTAGIYLTFPISRFRGALSPAPPHHHFPTAATAPTKHVRDVADQCSGIPDDADDAHDADADADGHGHGHGHGQHIRYTPGPGHASKCHATRQSWSSAR